MRGRIFIRRSYIRFAWGFRERQIDPKRAPGADNALQPQGSAHRRDHPFGIGETDSGTFNASQFSSKAIERREKTGYFIGAQAKTGVFDTNAQSGCLSGWRRPALHHHGALGAIVFNRIGKEV